MKNLNFWTIIIVGIALSLIPLAFGFFTNWMPNMKEAGYYDTYIEQLNTEVNKRPQAIKKQEEAVRLVEQKASEWRNVVARRTPPKGVQAGGIDLGVNAWQLAIDSRRFRNNIQRAVNAQVRKGGIEVVTGPLVPFPDESATTILANYFNYPAISFPVVVFNFGQITVSGTYDQILANVRSYANMPNYLAVASGLRLDGTSPRLTGTYSLSVVGFIRGDKIFSSVPEGGAGGAAGGFGAGGPGAGFRGGPPAGIGGPPAGFGGPGGPPSGFAGPGSGAGRGAPPAPSGGGRPSAANEDE